MQVSDAKVFAQKPAYLNVTKGSGGVWACAGAHALRVAIKEKSSKGVMDLLRPMDARSMAQVFREAGFSVDGATVQQGRLAVFESIKPDLLKALEGVAKGKPQQAKTVATSTIQRPSESMDALSLIQKVLRSPNVIVSSFGQEPMRHRGSLQMVAGQALEKGILGFGFDGIPGKYMVDSSMKEVVELHKEAAKSIATLSAQTKLHSWSKEQKSGPMHDFVPDSIQRLLQGALSLDAAGIVVRALASGSIAAHAAEIGELGITNLLAAQGLDVDAPTIDVQAQEMGFKFKEVDTERGMYFGAVVAQDHRASLVKVNLNEVIELTHKQAAMGKPRVGEQLRLEFKAGDLSVTSRNTERKSVER